jgi:tetratricopeptide (TPR) repeat protein
MFMLKKYHIAFILQLFLIFLIYSNTFNASWHYDDPSNILDNPRLHMNHISIESIVQTFFASVDGGRYLGNRYRPVPCLTFALNWYWGGDNVTGYHIVNILIHFFTSSILFVTILTLFKTPNLTDKYQGSEYFIALLAAVLWAINPIQTQAVTYIVQRMASMAAMFYILSIFFYVKGRLCQSRTQQVLSYTACFLSFLLALGSKENTAILPVTLCLIEITFFQNLTPSIIKKSGIFFALSFLTMIIIGSVFFMEKNILYILTDNAFKHRPFTLIERVLTEARIVVFHLSQIFYPIPDRLSLLHDITISTSLFRPWTTMPSILTIFFLICTGFLQIRKRPILSFAILFFFVNHLIESTVLPLQLIFEHRNYLPSLFIFFPVATGFKFLLDFYSKSKNIVYVILIVFMTFLLTVVGISTYIRNMDWATEKSLWTDMLLKAPGLALPYQYIGKYYNNIGDYGNALAFYNKSLSLKNQDSAQTTVVSLNNIAGIYLNTGKYETSLKYYKKALDIYPASPKVRYFMVFSLIELSRLEEALENVDMLISQGYYNYTDCMNQKAIILLKLKRTDEAIQCFKEIYQKKSDNKITALNFGIALSLAGKYKKAEHFLRRANQMFPSILPVFWLIENSIRAGDTDKTDYYIDELSDSHTISSIQNNLRELPKDKRLVMISQQLLASAIAEKMKFKTMEIYEINNVSIVNEQ